MGSLYLALGLLCAFALTCNSQRIHRVLGRPLGGMKISPYYMSEEPTVEFGDSNGEAWFQQPLDHFDANNTKTWAQHYFYNMKFIGGNGPKDGGVAFLMIGGEGPESAHWANDETLPYIQWAKQYNAAVFDLEHRYYGKSRPVDNQSVDNLKFLSSRQAIEDLAFFIRYINQQNKWTNFRWIVFGGSYSGAMALWMRQAHPELVVGAVGSSGPIQATLDFYQYLQVVQNSLGTYDTKNKLAANAGCVQKVKDGFQALIDKVSTAAGRDDLTKMFTLIPGLNDLDLNDNDLQNFYSTIYGNFQGAVQYSGDNAGPYKTGYGINDVCGRMMNATSPLQGLVDVNTYMATMDDQKFEGTANNYTDVIVAMKDESFDSDWADARSWTWQTCTEFGYFQSTDSNLGIFGAVTPNNLFINMCIDIFGDKFNADFIQEAVEQTNEHYGGAHKFAGTNVVIPNGNLDPWHALGKYTTDDYSQVFWLIDDSAHCGDMYPVNNVTAARYDKVHRITQRHIDLWLNSVPNPVTHLNKTTIAVDEPKKAERFPMNPLPFKSEITDLGKFISTPKEQKTPRYSFIGSRPAHGFVPEPEFDLTAADLSGYSAFTISQPVCHFNNQIPDTWKQRMWKNTKFAKPGGPKFLMLGGEGPANPEKWVLNEDIAYITYAKTHGATIYYMEHRCYGDSHDLMYKNGTHPDFVMLFCNSHQALFDVKQFIDTVNYQEGTTGPWITFGGSYSGALSLWAKQLFPQLVLGAVGSSAPIENKVDFFEYLQVTENSLRGYSASCALAVQAGFADMQQMILYPDGRKNLSDIFTLEPAWDEMTKVSELDSQMFFSNIFGQFQGAVQYSGDNTVGYSEGYGIPEVCAIMNNDTNTPLENIALVNEYMTVFYTGQAFNNTPNSYNEMIKELRDLESGGADRTWFYQTCNEFGFFQTTDYGYGIFGSGTPLNLYLQMCYDVFLPGRNDGNTVEGSTYTTDDIYAHVAGFHDFYGGNHGYKGTNVVAPNGSLDPWHALGLHTSSDPSVVIIKINGTAHCADMYPARQQDTPSLTAARKTISDSIGIWLGTTSPPTTPTGSPVTMPTDPSATTTTGTGSPATGSSDVTITTTVIAPGTGSASSIVSLLAFITAALALL